MPKIITIKQINNSTIGLPLSFETNLTRPLFIGNPKLSSDPADWDVSVIRFRIPNFLTPLFTFVDGRYSMTARYMSNIFTADMLFVPWNSNIHDRAVYSVQHFVLMLNNLISTVCAGVSAPTTDYPTFVYDEATELMSYIANKNFFATDGSIPDPVMLNVNAPLSQIIDGIPLYGSVYGDQILSFNTGNTVGDYHTMKSQTSIAEHIVDFARLVLVSNIPTDNEYIGVTNDVNAQNNITQAGLPVLMDFSPAEISINNYNNYINFNAIVPYRQVSIRSNLAFDNIVIDVYYETVMAGLQRIVIPPGTSADVKLMFTERSINKFA